MGVAVIAACPKDQWLALKNLEWAVELGGPSKHKALVFVEDGTNALPLVDLAKRLFASVDLHTYDAYSGNQAWPHPQNYAWQTAARFMDTTGQGPWFWWEPDATPLKRGWLDLLFDEYEKEGNPFMGHVSKALGHMNGVAFYPAHVSHHATDALLVMRYAFDVALWREIKNKTTDAAHLMAHFPRYNGVQLTVTDLKTAKALLNKEYLLFHGCNDGSLIDYLRGRKPTLQNIAGKLLQTFGLANVDGETDESESCWHQHKHHLKRVGYTILPYKQCIVDEPKIADQVDWECGTFNLPLSNEVCNFNPALIHTAQGLFLLPRRWTRMDERWLSRISVYRLVDMQPQRVLDTIKLPAFDSMDQHEDPRIVVTGNQMALAWCGWRHGRDYMAHQALTMLDSSFAPVSTLHPQYGGNGYKVGAGTGNEKNWVWFKHADQWHFEYSFKPHVVVVMHDEMRFSEYRTDVEVDWPYGEIRGGTPPVLVGDSYISFFHSSLPWRARQKRYYVGAYEFESKPPFKMLGYTRKPLFAGSEHESRTLGGPLAVFPCGAVLMNGEWLIAYGVNDERCGWMKIPNSDLLGLLDPC